MKKTVTLLALSLFLLPFVAQAQGSKSHTTTVATLGPGNFPYTSAASNLTVQVDAPDVATLGNAPYECGGQKYDCSATAWWLKTAGESITINFSEPVSKFSVVINGTNEGEVFTITPSTGKVSLSDFCGANFSTVAPNQLIDNATSATGTSITINNATGATSYTISHNGAGYGSRVSIPDQFVSAKVSGGNLVTADVAAIFPNPTSGRFEVRAPGRVGDLEVTDMLGRHVTKVAFDQQANLDLSAQGKGVYWVKIVDQNRQVSTQRIVVQ